MYNALIPGSDITVIKCNPDREETWRYTGKVLSAKPDEVILEALFNRPDQPFLDLTLEKGDRFIEVYYTRRWYNVYEIHSGQNGPVKGWYCNISLPAEFDISAGVVTYFDLALDLWVYPDGRQVILDEDEFMALKLAHLVTQQARAALSEVQALAHSDGLLNLFTNHPGETG